MHELSPSDTARLSTLTLNVLTAALAGALDAQSTVPSHIWRRALMAQIHAIAARWGFTSPAHFSQAFRTAYGLSPRQFRQQCTTVRTD
ncbi:helix-turn-helix domain-containing protein [Actinomadura sp. 6N118]|uniref:helix-turn-helix domain-containing protein n=1 Tax=Actinomadura sp. 6N118 TaxID=3375151 RepID=UPI0037A829FC